MIAAKVRPETISDRELLAFVSIPNEIEARVRWRPGNWRCDACGPSPWPTCAHARAIVNSTTYEMERQ